MHKKLKKKMKGKNLCIVTLIKKEAAKENIKRKIKQKRYRKPQVE